MKHVSLLVFALLLTSVAGCLESHGGTQQLARSDCYQCHRANYEATPTFAQQDPAVPNHLADTATYTQACGDCHVTTTWFSHPEKLFNVQSGAHADIPCNACHFNSDDNTGDAHGANTLCTTCHFATEQPFQGPGDMTTGHSDQPMFSYTSPPAGFTKDNFCLSCHPNGREKPHDDTIFPQNHHARNCDSCHDRTKGSDAMGQNADCRRCHSVGSLQSVGDHPSDVGTMPSPSGCLASGCHLGGGHGGDGGGG